jgi:hypothetical protein
MDLGRDLHGNIPVRQLKRRSLGQTTFVGWNAIIRESSAPVRTG